MKGIPPVEIDSLKRHLSAVACLRDPFQNPEALAKVAHYIQNQFEASGYRVEADVFELEGQKFENLIARPASFPSSSSPQFMVAAHFDAVPGTPGADDNASGVAAMLEAARLVAESNPDSPVHFAAFNLEEYGMIGSSRYVESLKKELFLRKSSGKTKDSFNGMISLEMVGFTAHEKGSQILPLILKPFYPDTGNFLALVGDLRSAALMQKAKGAFTNGILPVETLTVPLKGWEFPAVRLSDHSPFWDAGLPALLVTDTSFFRNPHYHTPEDRIETLNLDFLKSVTEGVVRLAALS